jgi:hypothetical protein
VDFLNNNAAAPTHVLLNGQRSAFTLTFDSPGSYAIDSGTPGSMLFMSSVNAAINVLSGSHRITAPVASNGDLNITTSAGSSLALDQIHNIYGFAIKKFGPGKLTLNAQTPDSIPGALAIAGGEVELNFNLNVPVTFAVPSLTIAGEGSRLVLGSDQDLQSILITTTEPGVQSLDLATPATAGAYRSIRFHSDDLDSLRLLLATLVNNAVMNPGDGIYDSGLASHPNSAIGIAQLLDAGGNPYVLLRPTLIGDLNLDGQVGVDDLHELISHLNEAGLWQEGDLDGDGQVTTTDLHNLQSNLRLSYGAVVSSHLVAAPEPAAILVMMPISILAARRRRR